MIGVKKLLAYLLSIALITVLLVGVLAFNFTSHFSKPDQLKTWLSQSQVYDKFDNQIISQAKQSLGDSQNDSVSLSDSAVQQAARNAFSNSLLQSSANDFLDANYRWLQDKDSQPQFSIDLSQAKQSFAQQVGHYVTQRLAGLPVCTAQQTASLQNTDPLSVPCRPATVSAGAAGAQVTQQLAASNQVLSSDVITANNLQPNGGRPYYQKLSFLPTAYRWSTWAPVILAVLALLLAVAIVFILPRRQGLRRLTGIFLFVGVLLCLTKFASDYAFNKLEPKLFNNASVGPIQQALTQLAHTIASALTRTNLEFGIGFIVLGAILAAVLIFTRQAHPKTTATTTEDNREDITSIENQPVAESNVPLKPMGPAPTKAKRPRLIQ